MWHKSAEMNVSEKALFKKSKIIEIDQVFIFLEQFLFFDFEILWGPDRLIVLINHYITLYYNGIYFRATTIFQNQIIMFTYGAPISWVRNRFC